jgi:hypothetical protein
MNGSTLFVALLLHANFVDAFTNPRYVDKSPARISISTKRGRVSFSGPRMTESGLETRLADSTLLLEAARAVGVSPPWNAPKFVWSWAFRFWQGIIPYLHALDECVPRDTCVNLSVLWWKAMAGDSVAYDLLPSSTRWLVSPLLRPLYPPLHHQSVAMRTAYLDTLLADALQSSTSPSPAARERIRVIVLGAGFDTRFYRLAPAAAAPSAAAAAPPPPEIDWIELDLPEVVTQKAAMLARLQARRRAAPPAAPRMIGVDLRQHDAVAAALADALAPPASPAAGGGGVKTRTVFVSEAVLAYLGGENVAPLLEM